MDSVIRGDFRLFIFEEGVDFSLPAGWIGDVLHLAEVRSHNVRSSEPNSTTVSRDEFIPLDYRVVTGDVIDAELPWIVDAYNDAFLRLAQSCSHDPLATSPFKVSAININVMVGTGATYEWHVDSNPLTGLLFATTHLDDEGGQLEFDIQGELLTVLPQAGKLLFFDARTVPHVVRPLRRESDTRVSIPMNYYVRGESIRRPGDLDGSIYGQAPLRVHARLVRA